jgi:hypothetical protein
MAAAILAMCLTGRASADLLVYDLSKHPLYPHALAHSGLPRLNDGDSQFVLPGRVVVMRDINFTHPSGSTAHFSLRDSRHVRSLTAREEFRKYLGRAGNEPDAFLKAAVWAVKHGLLSDAYMAVDRVLEIDPRHDVALRASSLRKTLKEPLPQNPQTEEKLRSIVHRPQMRFLLSNHFLLLTYAGSKRRPDSGKSRAEERLAMLEHFYERFVLLLELQGVQLEFPKERMMAVLFKDEAEFNVYEEACDATFGTSSSSWDPPNNVVFLCDGVESPRFKLIGRMIDEFDKYKVEARPTNPAEPVDRNVLNLLLLVERENQDLAAVSRVACHQLAANSGLLLRQVVVPTWIRAGLASWFEMPSDGAWAGHGAVNRERLERFRSLIGNEPFHTSFDLLANRGFVLESESDTSRRYTMAWAWVHFLMQEHPREFIALCRSISEMPPNVTIPGEVVTDLFRRAFGDIRALDEEWRAYMRVLKTDLERVEESSR